MADAFTLDSSYLMALRTEIKNDIAYARYRVGSTWHRAEIQNTVLLKSGVVEVTFLIDHTVSGNITVTGIELYDRCGARIGSKTVSITRADATEAILYVCRFSLFQVSENTGKNGVYDAL